MTKIMKLTSMDVVDTDEYFTKLFGFRETIAFQSKMKDGEEMSLYANAGYDSAIFFMLLGPILVMIVLYGVLVIVKKLSKMAT